jgi:hypothetical protein
MPAVKSACPHCHARLQAPNGLPATLLCPHCGTRFTLSAAGTVLLLPQPPQAAPPVGILVSSGPRHPAAPPPPAPPPAPAEAPARDSGLGLPLTAALCLVSLLVMAGCVWAVVAHLRHRARSEALTRAEPAAPAPDGALPSPQAPPAAEPATRPKSAPAAPAPAPAANPGPKPDPLAGYVPPSGPDGASPPPDGTSVDVSLPEAEQERVNRAMDRGVTWLKGNLSGSGPFTGRLGGQALGGLTLLACGVAPDDPAVRRAAARVRAGAGGEHQTYDLALAILFLDRLADRQDRGVIRTLAARLIAGQSAAGGWTYNCPPVQDAEREDLFDLLEALGSPESAGRVSGYDGPTRTTRPESGRVSGSVADRGRLPPRLKNLPVLQPPPGDKVLFRGGGGDNSNTQFALMALWVARKHGVPVERTMALVGARFRASQNGDGSWGYHPRGNQFADSMTCAGLLGLAVARGATRPSDLPRASARDPDVARALRYLGEHVGPPGGGAVPRQRGSGRIVGANAHGDLYFLWSVERVAVAYDLRTIEGKDWYAWGAKLLVDHQNPDGSWQDAHPGLPDTCFALLFLKRANVAQDLTSTLRSIGSGAGHRATGGGSSPGRVPQK